MIINPFSHVSHPTPSYLIIITSLLYFCPIIEASQKDRDKQIVSVAQSGIGSAYTQFINIQSVYFNPALDGFNTPTTSFFSGNYAIAPFQNNSHHTEGVLHHTTFALAPTIRNFGKTSIGYTIKLQRNAIQKSSPYDLERHTISIAYAHNLSFLTLPDHALGAQFYTTFSKKNSTSYLTLGYAGTLFDTYHLALIAAHINLKSPWDKTPMEIIIGASRTFTLNTQNSYFIETALRIIPSYLEGNTEEITTTYNPLLGIQWTVDNSYFIRSGISVKDSNISIPVGFGYQKEKIFKIDTYISILTDSNFSILPLGVSISFF